MILSKRMYQRGRLPANGQVIIFGMTQRDGGAVRVEDDELYEYLQRKEEFRTQREAGTEAPGLRPHQPRRRQVQQQRDDNEMFIIEDENTNVVMLNDEADDGENTTTQGGEDGIPAFLFNDEMERKERSLFGNPREKTPTETLLFIVPNRKERTLVALIEKYVHPGTVIFSDKWGGYVNLNRRFNHFTVVHKKRFVKYLFFVNRLVMKVTTNHIERVWVDVRKKMKGLKKEDVSDRIKEISYRRLNLMNEAHHRNVTQLLQDVLRCFAL